eukprot:TRINITY_DN1041_c0_g1_i2.p3 TRINITY_DN1041_c0_g1~~TRINITY_DN1041_c0_g1_i2.p3  ORF type:complete len:178 (-),score=35.79 TRINITY_DN1041_c0_g1_i2:651-1184(-)
MSCTTTVALPPTHARWIESSSYTYNDSTDQSALNKTVRNLVEYASANASVDDLSSYHQSYSSYYTDGSAVSSDTDGEESTVSLASHPLRFLEEVAAEIGDTVAVALACVTTYVRAVAEDDDVFTQRVGGLRHGQRLRGLGGLLHGRGGRAGEPRARCRRHGGCCAIDVATPARCDGG